MKKSRKLHLWIGLISSVFILVESITGLLLSEPWLLGGQQRPEMRVSAPTGNEGSSSNLTIPKENLNAQRTQTQGETQPAAGQRETRPNFNPGDTNGATGKIAGSSISRFVRGLHEGRIGTTNAKWLVDATAIALIILTSTGIVLSIKTLRAQSIRRKKRALEADEEEDVTD